MSPSTPWIPGLIVVLAALAGCIGGDDLETDDDKNADGASGGSTPSMSHDLFGWVVDGSFDGVGDVSMHVIGALANTTTNETGFYSFPELPRQEEIVVIAEHGRYVTQSKKILLPNDGTMRMNFTLEPRPEKKVWSEVLDFEGLLACQAVVEYQEGHAHAGPAAPLQNDAPDSQSSEKHKVDCGTTDPNNNDEWEFSVRPELAGVIVEVSWEAQSSLSENLQLTLEFPGHGGDNATLAQVVGGNVLKAQVNNHQAQRYYQDGGFIRALVQVDPNVDDEEAGTGAAFAYQQDFMIHATAFYVDPPPSTYSVFDA